MQTLADIMEKEIPETAATMRLTGLEMADAIHEVSLLRYSSVLDILCSVPHYMLPYWTTIVSV